MFCNVSAIAEAKCKLCCTRFADLVLCPAVRLHAKGGQFEPSQFPFGLVRVAVAPHGRQQVFSLAVGSATKPLGSYGIPVWDLEAILSDTCVTRSH